MWIGKTSALDRTLAVPLFTFTLSFVHQIFLCFVSFTSNGYLVPLRLISQPCCPRIGTYQPHFDEEIARLTECDRSPSVSSLLTLEPLIRGKPLSEKSSTTPPLLPSPHPSSAVPLNAAESLSAKRVADFHLTAIVTMKPLSPAALLEASAAVPSVDLPYAKDPSAVLGSTKMMWA